MRPSPKSEMMLYHEGEWELEAHTRSSCSTHGYFESWRDELLTPSQCWDSEISCFAHWCWSKPNVNYLRKSSYFCNEFHPSILIEKIWNFSISSKTKKWAILSLWSIHIYFFMRIGAVQHCLHARFAVAKIDRKCLQINDFMSCFNGADHIGFGQYQCCLRSWRCPCFRSYSINFLPQQKK